MFVGEDIILPPVRESGIRLDVGKPNSTLAERFVSYIEIILSVLFFDTAGAKKSTKRNAVGEVSLVAASEEGCAPSTAPPFEKGGRKLFILLMRVCVGFLFLFALDLLS